MFLFLFVCFFMKGHIEKKQKKKHSIALALDLEPGVAILVSPTTQLHVVLWIMDTASGLLKLQIVRGGLNFSSTLSTECEKKI